MASVFSWVSASIQTTKSFLAWVIPKFNADALPPLGLVNRVTNGLSPYAWLTISKVLSFDPSSTKMISKWGYLVFNKLFIVFINVISLLYAGKIIIKGGR